jgi:putative exosortase-associated protein (TIGR04073 family)
MKKLFASVLALTLVVIAGAPLFAAEGASGGQEAAGTDQVNNLKRGGTNVRWGWVEVMDHTGQEAAKGKNPGEHITGVVAGSAIGVRKGIHRIGAGAIDLLTFWIPKKEPLISPEEPRLK